MSSDPDGRVHVIGAGLAGLSAATTLAEQGRKVVLYEAASQAGGRCRSYFDAALGRHIDNGNHLFLSGNTGIHQYLTRMGTLGLITGPDSARLSFLDCNSSYRWCVDAGNRLLPWPLLSAQNRPPGTKPWEFLAAKRLLSAGPEETVAQLLSGATSLYARLWEPLAVAILNTPADTGAADLLGAVFRQAFRGGATTCLPRIAASSLSEVFVNPALKHLRTRGSDIRFNARLKEVDSENHQVRNLIFVNDQVLIEPSDQVILAVPPWVATTLLPEISAPELHFGIINAHFLLPRKTDKLTIIGLINGLAHWIFVRGDVASVTISAVDCREYVQSRELVSQLWLEICNALDMGHTAMGPYKIITEKRATISHDPVSCARRPKNKTALSNLFLAGDWTDTGLPATIEGAILSGARAAQLATNSTL